MTIRASTLFDEFRSTGLLQEMFGEDTAAERLAPAERCSSDALVFVDREEFVAPVLAAGAAVVITTPALAAAFASRPDIAVLTSPDVKLARALVTQRFFDRDLHPAGTPRIDPTAAIADSAQVAASARIGAQVHVGPGARIGEHAVVLAGCVVEERAVVGDRAVLHPRCVIGFDCEIGSDVIVGAGTVIGSEGFGFAQDASRRSHRIPQLGSVVIGDRVVIGANCCIDRGTHGATRIGSGTVMDNLCHVAHNVEIGENCILTAMLCVAGSTKIGDRVVTSGQVGILDHVTVADDVVLLQRAGVASDIDTAGAYAGAPLMPLDEHMKSQASIRRLGRMRETIKRLEARIAALEARSGAARHTG